MARTIKVNTLGPDGKWSHDEFDPGEEFWKKDDALRAEIKEMEESGELLGWCDCEGGSNPDHWRVFDNRSGHPDYRGPDNEEPKAGGSHGVICGDCGKVAQIG